MALPHHSLQHPSNIAMILRESQEDQQLLNSAYQVLMEVGHPLHQTDLQQRIVEKGVLNPGLLLKLEHVISREIQKHGSRFRKCQGRPGYVALQGQEDPPMKLKLTMVGSERDRLRYKRLKRLVKQTIFSNAAICDEVAKTEEKVTKAKEERKFLLKRLLQYQSLAELSARGSRPAMSTAHVGLSRTLPSTKPATEEVKTIKKKLPTKKLVDKESSDSNKTKSKKTIRVKHLVKPIPLDSLGRPLFPILLGSLTVHSIGEIVCDRPGYYCADSIYPVGYCSSRIFANVRNPNQQCLYNCQILDNGPIPKFELSAEDSPHEIYSGATPSECHSRLLMAINQNRGVDVVETLGKGAHFFGLSHPVIQNLIQNSLGSRKCPTYKLLKFEICKGDQEMIVPFENHPSVSYEALVQSAMFQEGMKQKTKALSSALEPGASLRSLLTSGPLSSIK